MRTLLAVLALCGGVAAAQPLPVPPSPAASELPLNPVLREEVLQLPAQVPDARGQLVSGSLRVTLFRPPGEGPFPVALILHGRDPKTRAQMPRPRFESATRYFLRKGFAVAVPQRLGYGDSAAAGDPEATLSCQSPRYAEALAAAALQVRRVLDGLSRRPELDTGRFVLAGVSVGGATGLAATALGLRGHVATLNFSGGHGGNPELRPGEPCAAERLQALFRHYGRLSAQHGGVPSLWLYAENDRFFSAEHARRWHAAYTEGGGRAELQVLPPLGEDGHRLFVQGNDHWQPRADAFLAAQGFDMAGAQPQLPAAPGRVLDDLAALPLGGRSVEGGYRRFLQAKLPRAFVIDPQQRRWASASGDDALSRALSHCERPPRASCRPYALDERVVWTEAPP